MTISKRKLMILQNAVKLLLEDSYNIRPKHFDNYIDFRKTNDEKFKLLIQIIKHPYFFWMKKK